MAHVTPEPGVAGPERLLIVDSVTGVDVSLEIAGTGARSLAFLIDFVIRSVLAVAWYVVATLIFNGRWSLEAPLDPPASWYLYVALPTSAIYLLYHAVLEIAMRGRTPGKRMVGVRIVTRDGAAPGLAAHLVRNVFRLVDSFPAGYGVGLITSVITRDHVRVGDLAAGTLLVYDKAATLGGRHLPSMPRGSRLDSATAELIADLLARWNTLDSAVRVRFAQSLLDRVDSGGRFGMPASSSASSAAGRSDFTRAGQEATATPIDTASDDAALRRALEELLHGSTGHGSTRYGSAERRSS